MRDCESDLERVLVLERERETFVRERVDSGRHRFGADRTETRRGITHERDRKGAADASMI